MGLNRPVVKLPLHMVGVVAKEETPHYVHPEDYPRDDKQWNKEYLDYRYYYCDNKYWY
jgi:hypothetical protein